MLCRLPLYIPFSKVPIKFGFGSGKFLAGLTNGYYCQSWIFCCALRRHGLRFCWNAHFCMFHRRPIAFLKIAIHFSLVIIPSTGTSQWGPSTKNVPKILFYWMFHQLNSVPRTDSFSICFLNKLQTFLFCNETVKCVVMLKTAYKSYDFSSDFLL